MLQRNPSGQTKQPIISVRGLTRVFGSGESASTAVNGIDLDIYTQEFLAVTGRSGSGKTTLLNLMAGLDRPTSGSLRYRHHDLARADDAELTAYRRRYVGFVFQLYNLIPSLTARENVSLVCRSSLDQPALQRPAG